MANLVAMVVCVKGKKEDREKLFDALYVGAENLRVGRGMEDPFQFWSEGDYEIFRGSANNWSMEDVLGSYTNRYDTDDANLKVVSLQTASEMFNLEIEAFSTCDDCYEHWYYKNGKEQKADKRRRDMFKFDKKDIKKIPMLKEYFEGKAK